MTAMNRWDARMFQDLVNVADDQQLQHMSHVAEREWKSRMKWGQRLRRLLANGLGYVAPAAYIVYVVMT